MIQLEFWSQQLGHQSGDDEGVISNTEWRNEQESGDWILWLVHH